MSKSSVLRRCVTCRKLIDRKQLLRVTKDYQDGVVLGEGTGRSAYLCFDKNCIQEALRRKRLQKSLRCQIPENIIEMLQKKLNLCTGSASEAI